MAGHAQHGRDSMSSQVRLEHEQGIAKTSITIDDKISADKPQTRGAP
jgi:hypothetical protein